MARATAFVGGLVLGGRRGMEDMVTHADPASADVQAAAEQANVEPSDLLAAMDSTGIANPFVYLRAVGELSPLAVPPSRPASSPTAPAVANSRDGSSGVVAVGAGPGARGGGTRPGIGPACAMDRRRVLVSQ